MEHIVNKKSTPLPYASIISRIICTCGVYPLDNEEKFKVQEIGINTLSNLGYLKQQRAWVRKQARMEEPHVQDDDMGMEEQAYEEVPPGSPVTSQTFSTSLRFKYIKLGRLCQEIPKELDSRKENIWVVNIIF